MAIYFKKKDKRGASLIPRKEEVNVSKKFRSEDELVSLMHKKPGFRLLYKKEAFNFFVVKFEVHTQAVTLLSVRPSENEYGAIHEYAFIINKKRRRGGQLMIFFDKTKRHSVSNQISFNVDLIYDDENDNRWRQTYHYHSTENASTHAMSDPELMN